MNLKKFRLLLILSIICCLIVVTFSQVKQFKYQESIKSANSYYEKGDYINAKVGFQLALRIKPNDEYATEMITVTLDLIKGQSDKRKKYSDLLVQADQDFKKLKLELAKSYYQQALTLFPFEKYPKKQIERINLIILENLEIIRDNEAAIIEGDRLFTIKEYEDAKVEFQYALGLIPGQEYPKQRLRDLRRIMSGFDEALTQLDKINTKLSITAMIDDLIKKGEEYLLVEDLYNAERTYRDALMLSPENDILRTRLQEIEQAISEKRTTPLEDYKNAIREGNKLMLEGKTVEAKKFYDFAARLRPTEQNPLTDTNLMQANRKRDLNYDTIVNEALKQLKSNNLASSLSLLQLADSLRQKDALSKNGFLQDSITNVIKLRNQTRSAFDQYLIEARKLLNSNRLAKARIAIENAQKINAEFDLSQLQINLLNELNNSLSHQEQIASFIRQAYENQLKGDFLAAQKSYQKALKLDPNSTLITQRLFIIQNLLNDEQARNIFLYNQALNQAEQLLASGDFKTAELQLQMADSLHQKQITITEKYNRLNNLYQIQLKDAQKKYDALIVNADYYYRAREYDKALQSYVDARELFPFEKYPQDMIARITNQFSSRSLQTIAETSVEIKNRGIHKISFEPIDISERNDIYFYIQLKNIAKIKNLKVIFNYGRDGQKNGGVIVRLVESDETTDYLVRVGNQYRWFSEDNNWISLQAEGGDVELLLCKITKAE